MHYLLHYRLSKKEMTYQMWLVNTNKELYFALFYACNSICTYKVLSKLHFYRGKPKMHEISSGIKIKGKDIAIVILLVIPLGLRSSQITTK